MKQTDRSPIGNIEVVCFVIQLGGIGLPPPSQKREQPPSPPIVFMVKTRGTDSTACPEGNTLHEYATKPTEGDYWPGMGRPVVGVFLPST